MSEGGEFREVHPVLPVRDLPRSIRFYEALGFRKLFGDDDGHPGYAGVGRDGVEIHLQTHAPEEWERDGVDRPMLRFLVRRPEALFEEFRPSGAFHERTALRETAWGTREFAFYDPDLNGLTFYENLPAPPASGP